MRPNIPRPSAPRPSAPRSAPRRLLEEHEMLLTAQRMCFCEECRAHRTPPRAMTREMMAARRARIRAARPKLAVWRALNDLERQREWMDHQAEEQVYRAGLALRGRE